ncbi:MAG: 4Fe-4S dicluster domain-containing protein [Phycisphaerae bacterium]|nr:4Fe-4S dicluster domain-containing protein [Phycisphaerae bacterium]
MPPRPDTAEHPVCSTRAPARLHIPLAQDRETAATPLVEPGHTVKPGTLLAESPDGNGRVHSPVAGVVRGVIHVDTPYRQHVPAVQVESAPPGQQEVPAGVPHTGDWPAAAELVSLAIAHGVILPDAAAVARAGAVNRIIVNGMDTAPRQTVNVRTLADHVEPLMLAAARLHAALRAQRTDVVVSRTRPDLAAVLRGLCPGRPFRVRAMMNRYPQAHPHLLVAALTGCEVPIHGSPLDCGAWVIDAVTLWNLYGAVASGSPVAWHTITLLGDAVLTPGNYRVPVGLTVRQVVERAGLAATPQRIVAGGWLNGVTVAGGNVVLTRTTRCLTVQSRSGRRPPPAACIRCGACLEACPVGLDPRALYDRAEQNRFDRAERLHPRACLDCGLCDYVCPSSLPLMRGVQWCCEHVRSG